MCRGGAPNPGGERLLLLCKNWEQQFLRDRGIFPPPDSKSRGYGVPVSERPGTCATSKTLHGPCPTLPDSVDLGNLHVSPLPR